MAFQLFYPLRSFFKRCHGQFRRSSTCFLFPGQGAQHVGMCKSFLKEAAVIQLFDDAQKILGYDLLSLCLNGPVEELKKTEKCQPAVVVSSLAALQYHRAKQSQVFPDWSNELDANTTITAGFSVGELTALIFSGALSFKDGLRLVHLRAQAMQEASDQHPSCMVSIMASRDLSVQELCDSAKEWSRHRGVQEPVACTANYLFPVGWVLGGDKLSLQYVLEFGKAKIFQGKRDGIRNNCEATDDGLQVFTKTNSKKKKENKTACNAKKEKFCAKTKSLKEQFVKKT